MSNPLPFYIGNYGLYNNHYSGTFRMILEPLLLLPFLPGIQGNATGSATQDNVLHQQFLSGESVKGNVCCLDLLWPEVAGS